MQMKKRLEMAFAVHTRPLDQDELRMRYNNMIQALRATEYPMLKGWFFCPKISVLRLTVNEKEPPISTMPEPLCLRDFSLKHSRENYNRFLSPIPILLLHRYLVLHNC
jgi:hypothetical protein